MADKQWGHVPCFALEEDEALAQSIDDDITETFLPAQQEDEE